MAVNTLKALRREIAAKRSEYTDREVLTSRAMASFYEGKAATITSRYKSKDRLSVSLHFHKNSESVAYTDGSDININVAHSVVWDEHLTRKGRCSAMTALFTHELGHCLYTDFTACNAANEALQQGHWLSGRVRFTDPEDIRREKEFWGAVKTGQLSTISYIYHHISNVIEDGYIEYRLLDEYPGDMGTALMRFRKQQIRSMPTLTEMLKKEEEGNLNALAILMNELLGYAKYGRIWLGEAPASHPYAQALASVMPFVDHAVSAPTTEERLEDVDRIIIRLWDYISEEIKRQEEEAEFWRDLLSSLPGVSEDGDRTSGPIASPQSGKSRSRNVPNGKIRTTVRKILQEAGEGESESEEESASAGSASTKESDSQSKSTQPSAGAGKKNRGDNSEEGSSDGAESSESGEPSDSENAHGNAEDDSEASTESSGTGEIDDEAPAEDEGKNGTGGSEDTEETQNSGSSTEESTENGNEEESGAIAENKSGEESEVASEDKDGSGEGSDSESEGDDGSEKVAESSDEKESGTETEASIEAGEKSDGKFDDISEEPASDGAESSESSELSEGENTHGNAENGSESSTQGADTSDGESSTENGESKSGTKDSGTSSRIPDHEGACDELEGDGSFDRDDEYMPHVHEDADTAIERLLNDVEETVACEELERERTNELNASLDDIDFGDCHKGVHATVHRIPTSGITEEMKEKYNSIAEPLHRISKRLQKSLIPALHERENGGRCTGLVYGRRIHGASLARNDGKIFYKNKLPEQVSTLAVGLLLDESGSMHGRRSDYARATAIIINDFCEGLRLPHMIYGHNGYRGVDLYSYAEFESYDKLDKYRLMDIGSDNSNRDGYALRYMVEKLAARPEAAKILIIVSDGQPAAYGYGGRIAAEDLKAVKALCRKKHIHLVAAAIGDDKDRIQEIYGDSFLDITNLEQMPALMTKLIKKDIYM